MIDYAVGGIKDVLQLHGYGSLFALAQLQQKLLYHTFHEYTCSHTLIITNWCHTSLFVLNCTLDHDEYPY